MPLSLEQLVQAVGGHVDWADGSPRAPHSALRGVVTDSRRVEPGDVFWALPGPRRNGADFAAAALEQGAVGVVTSRCDISPPARGWVLRVADSAQALWRLASWRRNQFTGQVVAVTGSVGKTTTRRMVECVLGQLGSISASPANYNNHVGLPLSMLPLGEEHHGAVYELGANAPGEIAALAELCRPHVGVITPLGDAHLAGFGSPAAVALAKTELLESLPYDGAAVMYGDDPALRRLASRSRPPVVWYGRQNGCQITASNVSYAAGWLRFDVESQRMRVPVWGRHHLPSALAAVAVGRVFGVSLAEIAVALETFRPAPMRCQMEQIAGVTVINDAYNSNPTSLQAALELLRETPAERRRIAILGDMRELGQWEQEAHYKAGEQTVTLAGADAVVACGDLADVVVAGAREAGMPGEATLAFDDPLHAIGHLCRSLNTGDVVLIKGSRALAMERLIEQLRLRLEPSGPAPVWPTETHWSEDLTVTN